jgi:hypothetical protein
MGQLLDWELDSSSMTPDQFHSLHQALLIVASDGDARAVEAVYHRNVIRTQFWCERYGPRLLYLLYCQGCDDFTEDLAKDMASEVCHAVFNMPNMVSRMMSLLRSTSCMYPRRLIQSQVTSLSLAIRLVRFILNGSNFSPQSHFFLYLCELGLHDLVAFVLDVMSQDLRDLAFSILDSRRMSPLYLAAAKGHLDVVKLLFERGCPLTHPDTEALPEVYAAAVCLRSTFHKPLLESTKLAYRKFPALRRLREPFPGALNGCFPSSEHALSLRENASQIIDLFVSELNSARFRLNDDFFAVLCFLASCPSLDLTTPMLRLFLEGMDCHTFPDNPAGGAAKLQQVILLLPDPDLSSSSSSTALNLFDQILLNFVSEDLASELITPASGRGLWGVVEKCHLLMLQGSPDHACVSVELAVLADAAAQGKFDFLTSVLGNLQRGDGVVYFDLIGKLLSKAVVHGSVEAVSFLLAFVDSCDPLALPLCKAIRFRRHSCAGVLFSHMANSHNIDPLSVWRILETAVHGNDSKAVEVLFELRDKVRGFEAGEFWWRVFAGAAESGHEGLALQAVGCMPESQVQRMVEESRYSALLGWCCYWGMKDLLECIPCTSNSILAKPSDSCPTPPWASAMIGGHIGKLSHLESFPSWEDIEECAGDDSDLGNSPDQILMLGAFHKLMSGSAEARICELNHRCHNKSVLRIVMEAIHCRQASILAVYLEHMGRYAGDFVRLNQLLRVACSVTDNLPIVKLILQCLFNSPASATEQCYSSLFSLSVRRGEVGYVRAFLSAVPVAFESSRLDHPYPLHSAVCSGSPEMVDCILGVLGSNAPEECYKRNDHGEYPLLCAFALGQHQVVVRSSLLSVAVKSAKFREVLEPNWREFACAMHGCFDLLMHTNSSLLGSLPSCLNLQSTACHSNRSRCDLMSLGGFDSNRKFSSLIHKAVWYRDTRVLQALLVSSDGAFCSSVYHDIIYEPGVWQFLNDKDHRRYVFQCLGDDDRKKLREEKLLTLVQRHECEEKMLVHLKLGELSVLTEAYTRACMCGRSKVIDYLLSLSVAELSGGAVKLLGIRSALETGHYQLAADLVLRMDRSCPLEIEFPNVVNSYVFSAHGYSEILNAFFASLCSTGLYRQLPLASRWVTRDWSEEEGRLVVSRLGSSTFAPPNPWVFSDDSSWDLSVTVDWNAFSECTLASPCVMGTDVAKFRHVPLLVESIVFSQEVLGLLSPQTLPGPGEATQNLFEYCRRHSCSSVIVSCQVWPAQPSFSNGVLIFAYHPDTRTVHSVDLEKLTEPKEMNLSMGYDSVSEFRNKLLVEQQGSLKSIAKHYERILGGVSLCQKCSVSVKFSTDVIRVDDGRVLEFYSILVSSQLDDLVKCLGLVSRPEVLYKDLYPEYRAAARAPAKIRPFEVLVVSFEVCSGDPTQPAMTLEVSLERTTLHINVTLPRTSGDHFNKPLPIPVLSPHSKLAHDLKGAILNAELLHTQKESVEELGRKLMPFLKSSLKFTTSLAPDFLSVLIDEDGSTRFKELETSRMENLVYFKCVQHHLGRFLCLFLKMLKVFQYKPRIHTHINSLFEAGFRVVLKKRADLKPEFSENDGVPVLCLPIRFLLSVEKANRSLLSLFRDVLTTVKRRDSVLKNFSPLVVPAPFASFIDLSQSEGLLYPVFKEAGLITVQLADYYGNDITTPPTVNCCLEVSVKHVASKTVVVSSSSVEPLPRLASNHLLVTEGSGGTFKIEWTPQDYGLFVLSIRMSGIHVIGSPFKSFSAVKKGEGSLRKEGFSGSCGTRQANTDYPIVCVVSHSTAGCSPWAWQCQSATPPPVKLLNRKRICPTVEAPVHQSREHFLREIQSQGKPVHQISMCSAYGGARKWSRATSPFISVYITSADSVSGKQQEDYCDKFTVIATPLSRGYYRVSLSSAIVGSFSIFSACACCNSVLTMHWKDGRGFLPSSIYVVPGAFSVEKSHVSVIAPRKWQKSRRKGKLRRKFNSGRWLGKSAVVPVMFHSRNFFNPLLS